MVRPKKIKFYLAARFPRREEMEGYSNKLKELGWWPNCKWVYGGEDGLTRSEIAVLDMTDVKNSDVLIIFTHKRGSKHSGGGRHFEMGYAAALGKPIIVIGDYEHVFCHAPGNRVYPDWDTFINAEFPVQ